MHGEKSIVNLSISYDDQLTPVQQVLNLCIDPKLKPAQLSALEAGNWSGQDAGCKRS
ncbi:MAG: hypothetical protein AAGA83_01740 [Cyanobacteria bacterium P01_F01_bin.116]